MHLKFTFASLFYPGISHLRQTPALFPGRIPTRSPVTQSPATQSQVAYHSSQVLVLRTAYRAFKITESPFLFLTLS